MGHRLRHGQTAARLLGMIFGGLAAASAAAAHAADLDGNGIVDAADQSVLLASWGECPAPCPADLDADGVVDGADFAILLDASESAESTDTVESIDDEGLYEGGDGTGALEDDPTFGTTEPVVMPSNEELVLEIHNVPLPAPVWLGLTGLAGAVIVRRRWFGRFA